MRLVDADTIEEGLGVEDRDLYVQHILDSAPTIEAEPIKHGRWIDDGKCYECSSCGIIRAKLYKESLNVWNYCSNCGAKMDGGEK